MLASVLIEYNVKSLNKTFEYIVPSFLIDKIKVGHKVLVPFGRVNVNGYIISFTNKKDETIKYKEIINIINEEFYLNEELLLLGKYLSNNTFCNLINAYNTMLPKSLKVNSDKKNIKYEKYIVLDKYDESIKLTNKQDEVIKELIKEKEIIKSKYNTYIINSLIKKELIKVVNKEVYRSVYYNKAIYNEVILNDEQDNAYNSIINEKNNNTFLIYGVTGSGKTEVYIKLIKYYLSLGKSAIYLVPEISLTPQMISRLKYEFNDDIACIHSSLSDGERYDEYRKIYEGKVKVVLGARSAVFAPLKNLGIIIVDECSSASYKQDNSPKYNALDIALERSKYNKAITVMGSATPSLEQYARGCKNVYKLISLENRVNKTMPKVKIIDMTLETKKRNFILSEELVKQINIRLDKKEQVILLLNRRGFSTIVSCSSCGFTYKCPSCDITLTYHKQENLFKCHYCGYTKLYSNICPSCKEKSLNSLGLGTEKLEEYIKKVFPNAKVLRMDTDTVSKKNSYERIVDDFKNHKYDILVGTQMISKGHNFPLVSLVGIINADSTLNIPDFRSCERTFELLMQTGGRAGRCDIPGEVLVQTYNKDNYVFKYIVNYDYKGFFINEMNIRKKLKYPPYYYITSLKIVSKDFNIAKETSVKIKSYLDNNLDSSFIILGPSTCKIFKLKDNYNFNILIKYKSINNLYNVLNTINQNIISNKVRLEIDVNPLEIS